MGVVIHKTALMPLLFRTLKISFMPLSLLFLFFVTLFFGVQNLSKAMTVFILDLPFTQSIVLFFSTYFDVANTFSRTTFILLLLIAFLEALTFVLFYEYMKKRRDALRTEKASVLVSTLLTLFGTSCAACGGAVLSLLSSFGLVSGSALFQLLDSTVLLSFVFVFLLFTVYRMLQKVANPLVC